MPIKKLIENNEYRYILWHISSLEKTEHLIRLLNPNKYELRAIKKITHVHRKKQNISARLALNNLAKKKVVLKYTKKGVPYCDEYNHISISHSNEYSMVIHSNNLIGVDIQLLKQNICDIKNKFINKLDYIKFNNNNRINLHLAWCSKEAIYKTLNGASCSMKQNIDLDFKQKKGYFNDKEIKINYKLTLDLLDNYFISIAQKCDGNT